MAAGVYWNDATGDLPVVSFFAKGGKALEKILQYCSEETGYKQQEVETIIDCFLDKISQELSEGHTVDLGACFAFLA